MNSNYKLLLYRKQAKLGQKELGEKLGLTRNMISMFESGKAMPMLDTMVDIARILSVDPAEIWPDMFARIATEREVKKAIKTLNEGR